MKLIRTSLGLTRSSGAIRASARPVPGP